MTIKVFLSGQSNALGRGTGGPSFSGVSSDVSVWNNINPLGANGSSFVTASAAQAAGVFEFTDRNNFGVWFCDRLARTQFDDVTLTCVARGGSPIAYWAPSETTFPMLAECTSVWSATGQGPADVFLWHQGESDESGSVSAYGAAFAALVSNLKAAGVIDDNTAIIVVGLAQATDVKVAFSLSALFNCAVVAGGAYAQTQDLANDGVHFTGPALYLLGAMNCYSAWLFEKMKG